MKLEPLDIVFSEFIRKRAMVRVGGCERCLHKKTEYKRLQCSHFHGRSRRSVRWDEDNAVGLCPACHLYFTAQPIEHTQWFEHHLGGPGFIMLQARMRNIGKPDVHTLTIYYKAQIDIVEKQLDSSNK